MLKFIVKDFKYEEELKSGKGTVACVTEYWMTKYGTTENNVDNYKNTWGCYNQKEEFEMIEHRTESNQKEVKYTHWNHSRGNRNLHRKESEIRFYVVKKILI